MSFMKLKKEIGDAINNIMGIFHYFLSLRKLINYSFFKSMKLKVA